MSSSKKQKLEKTSTRGELGEYLRQRRLALDISLREAAERTGAHGLSRSYLGQLETGRIQRPNPETLSHLVSAYQADYSKLLRAAGYAFAEPEPEPRQELEWLPPDTARLNSRDRAAASQFIEYLLWRRRPPESEGDVPRGRWITWGEVQEWAHELRAKLDRHGFDPDLVIGLGRGGAILGGMIAGALGLKPVQVLDMVHDPVAPKGEREIKGHLDLSGVKKALLVQGEVRSGGSLVEARKQLAGKPKSPELRTIALVVYPSVPLDQRPDEYKKLGELDPPWRRVPGYFRGLRREEDDDA
jgi:hypoxanthine phosphoribosyltransferase